LLGKLGISQAVHLLQTEHTEACSIQESEEPEREPVFLPDFNIIDSKKTLGNIPNLGK
jgi:hypothetical protein